MIRTPPPPAESGDSPTTPADAGQMKRVSVVTGDRVCVSCGYNLVGQSIMREPRYDLLITTCPECGVVAAMQDYPILGRWANRWAMLVAALWLLALGICFVVPASAVIGMSTGFSFLVMDEARFDLRKQYREWLEDHQAQQAADAVSTNAQSGDATAEPVATEQINGSTDPRLSIDQQELITLQSMAGPTGAIIAQIPNIMSQAWYGYPDIDIWIEDSGVVDAIAERGVMAYADWRVLPAFLGPLSIAFIAGCVWAALLLHKRSRGRVLYAIYMGIILGGIFLSIRWQSGRDVPTETDWIAIHILVLPFLTLALACAWGVFVIGLLVGRKLIRSLIQALLPPRLRSSFATLWLVDDLDPPTPGLLHRVPGR